jgi:prepilin-type N-terminal cleavage/methylation domain-containing protein
MFGKKEGFTLIELLIAVVIIGILAAVGLGQFFTAQIRSRDAQRKENLSSVAKALELYYNDYGRYPNSLDWGERFEDAKGTVYMVELPNDPVSGVKYDYRTEDGINYKLYAHIEHEEDRCFASGQCLDGGYPGADCGEGDAVLLCHYCLASPNISCQE